MRLTSPPAIAVTLGAALALTACAPTVPEAEAPTLDTPATEVPSGDEGAEASGDPVDIAFVTHTQDVTDLFGQMLIGVEETLEEEGIEYNLTAGAPPNSDAHEAMDRILSDLLAVDPDYLIASPTSYELNEPRYAELEAAGTKLVIVDVAPPEDPQVDPLTWVNYSHVEMGRAAATTVAEQACESADGPVQVAYFWGPAASEVSLDRGEGIAAGLEETFGECGVEYQIVEEVYADFNREKAYNLMETVATAHPDLDIAFGFNSNTAMGMVEALKTAGRLQDVRVVGMGGQPNELAYLCNGELNNSVFRNPRLMGQLAVEAIVADLEGRADELEEVTYMDLTPVADCEDVFEVAPAELLDQPDFRDAIPAEMWDRYSS